MPTPAAEFDFPCNPIAVLAKNKRSSAKKKSKSEQQDMPCGGIFIGFT
jgi:hypothetical protein